MSYQVRIARDAEKDIAKIRPTMIPKIIEAIRSLAEDPRPRGSKKLKGTHSESWRIRTGDYRIIYVIDDGIRIVEVREVGHRRDIYR